MNYNTEMMNGIATQVAENMKTAVLNAKRAGEQPVGIAEIEMTMREMLRQIGQQALGQLLSSLQSTPAREIPGPCGGTLHYQRMRPVTVISVFDRVQYKRAYYAGCVCQHGKAPLDEQYGLEPGAVTAGLAGLLGLAGVGFSFDESPQ